MKILLVSTDLDVWALGLRSISAVLKAAGYSTELFFLPTTSDTIPSTALDTLAGHISPGDILGLSCLAQGSDKAKQVIARLGPLCRLVLWGGVHASLNPESCVEWADIVCRGEGEEMMVELLGRLAEDRDWHDIQNIAYKQNNTLTLNPVRAPISNLDDLPLPDYSFEHEFHLAGRSLEQVYTLTDVTKTGRIVFNSSRGCALHCTYCCNVQIKALYPNHNRYVRRMSVPRLIEHAQKLRQIFPQAKNFYFLDEDFGARPLAELIQLADEFPQKVGMPFECLTHPAQVSHKKMDLLVRAGLFRLNMGIESGSERTRKTIYNRQVSNRVVKQAVQVISTYPQVKPFYLLIIANPYEERSDLVETARFILDIPPGYNLIIYSLVFFPGSLLYQRAIQDELIGGAYDSAYEMNYCTGLHYQEHVWKRKNLYLNGLIYLMVGSSTKHRIGLLPRFLIKALLDPRIIEFGEKNTLGIRLLIAAKQGIKTTFQAVRDIIHRPKPVKPQV